MTKIFITITLLILSWFSIAQVSENRTLTSFSKLQVSQGIEVHYTVSNTNEIKVETDDKEKLRLIKTEVENETLKIFIAEVENNKANRKNKKMFNTNFNTLKVYVSGSPLKLIKATSSATISLINTNKAEQIEVYASSSGSVSGNFDCDHFNADIASSGNLEGALSGNTITMTVSSSGQVQLNGKVSSLQLKASSSGDCNLKKLITEKASIKASSSANVTITTTKTLEAVASSSAEINYFGNPTDVNKEEIASGSVNKK
ncbi:head GIN domain-containing protein [Flavobacterium sp.]|uniref:head GIN domain-containing protein n=1 Tax=Flavobacterium sp. TaxID=239 RepID=UPI0025BFBD52|nr:head GIN domain-containing protein [Flavobacterium sp.]